MNQHPHPACGHPLPSDGRGAGGEGSTVINTQLSRPVPSCQTCHWSLVTGNWWLGRHVQVTLSVNRRRQTRMPGGPPHPGPSSTFLAPRLRPQPPRRAEREGTVWPASGVQKRIDSLPGVAATPAYSQRALRA